MKITKKTGFWDNVSQKYDKQATKTYKTVYEQTHNLCKSYLKDNFTVLELGCGTGILTIPLASAVKHIHAIDISGKMIDICKEKTLKHEVKNISFDHTDIFSESLNNRKFDAILAFNVLHFTTNPVDCLNRMKEILKPDGLVISATDCMKSRITIKLWFTLLLSRLGIIPSVTAFSVSGLRNLFLKNGFNIIFEKNLFPNPPNYFIVANLKNKD